MKQWINVFLIQLSLAAGCTQAVSFYVSPQGKDSNIGTVEQPFATLEKARNTTREMNAGIPKKIVLLEGEYFLDQTLEFDSRDNNLTIEAMSAGKAILYGGRPIENWTKENDRFYSAALPDVKGGDWDFRTLVVNGRLCPRARLPQEGAYTHTSKFDVRWMSTSAGGWERKPTLEELTTLHYDPKDIPPDIDINNAEITVYHLWDESLVGVKSIDPDTGTIIFSNPSGHPVGGFGVNKYVLWNVREGMTRPGQWHLDRTHGKIVYWPLPDETMDTIRAIAPRVETIIKIRGSKAKPAEGITIKNISFSVTNTPLKSGGFGAGLFSGAVEVAYARRCQLVNLEVFNVGGQGINGSCSEGIVQNCRVHNTGACGIKFGGFASQVLNNHIHHNGIIYPSGIALWCFGEATIHEATPESNPEDVIDENVFALVADNEIHDTSYTAIAGYGRNLVIKNNRIYRAMQVLNDGGGIYITFCTNIKVLGNFVSDISYNPGEKRHAYYIDEQAKECLIEGNLSLRCPSVFLGHMYNGNILRNNVFITAGDCFIQFPRVTNCAFEKNIVAAEGTIHIDKPDALSPFINNILYGVKGGVSASDLDEYRKVNTYPLKPDSENIFSDPKLLEYEKGKVLFKSDSPAPIMGIEPIDVSNAGLRDLKP